MGVRFTAILSGAVMLVGATINWYAVTDAFQGSGLQTWFTNNLNYIPGFDELGISPFYRGMPASAKFAAIGFMIFGCGVEMAGITVSRGIVKWFKGREMALAMGSEMALARLGVATCMIFSPVFAKLGVLLMFPVQWHLVLCYCLSHLLCLLSTSSWIRNLTSRRVRLRRKTIRSRSAISVLFCPVADSGW